MEEREGTERTNGEQELKATDVTAVWGKPLVAVHCAHCDEAHLVPEGELPGRCPFCLQGPISAQPAYLRDEPPEQVVPYEISEQGLRSILDPWSRGGWFRPPELNARQLTQRAQRYLIPLWLVDGRVEGSWRADVGFDYQVVSSQDQYRAGGGWSSQEVRETRVRWEPRVGRIDRSYQNVPAPALDDHRALMARLGEIDLSQRASYGPEAVSDAAVRIPTLAVEAAWPGAETAFVRKVGRECRDAADADHVRDLTLQAQYQDLNWTQLLLPAYVTWYREGGRIWPLLINGQNGHVSGVKRASARKANTTSLVLGGLALLLFVIGGLLALLGALLPPMVLLGGAILVIGLILAIVAPIPAISVWISNRRTTPPPL